MPFEPTKQVNGRVCQPAGALSGQMPIGAKPAWRSSDAIQCTRPSC
jgi:hypothetical protein